MLEASQVHLDWEHQVNSLAKRFTSNFGGLVVRGNYVERLAIVAKVKGLGRANR